MKTSNPSSGEFQDQLIDGKPLYELVGEKVAQWGADCMGDEYSYIGAVVGATYPEMGKSASQSDAKILTFWYLDMVHRADRAKIWYTSSMKTDWVRS